MYLKEIQAYGFKSFADKTNFEFTNNLNGIVGPNGSGKSNVVDAVRWVLGEQSNKSLRATDNISVIFSGSKSRKPLNSAMVNIIFDNTDRHLPIDFNEVSIKRIIYRSGENEYYLNGEKCRLKDITELLTDSGAAKESFNIIGQGKIDEILSTKPNDRRVIFEEAAGVLKYKKRKEEAIRKLERTNTNINRVNDIVAELEGNLEPLRIQSLEAKEYLACKDKLASNDIALMIHDVNNYSNELNNSKEKINNLNDKIAELNKNNATYDVSIIDNKGKLSEIDNLLMINNNKLLDLTKKLEQTDGEINLLKERRKYVDKNLEQEKISNLNETILDKKHEVNSLKDKTFIYDKRIKDYENEIDKNKNKYNDIKDKLFKNNNKIEENNRIITDLNYKINYLEESINNGGSVPNSVKNLLHNPLFNGVHGTIGSLITVPNEYALAVSTALGGASNYLVVDDTSLASRMVEYLKHNKLGRATFFPIDVIKGRFIDNDTLNKLSSCNGYISSLNTVISYDNKYESIIMNQLGNVILADNIDNANYISKVIANRYKIVTLDGQVVNVGGSITGGDKIKNNDIIKTKYELEECNLKLKKLSEENKMILNEINDFNKVLKEYDEKNYNLNNEKLNVSTLLENDKMLISKLSNEITVLEKELRDIQSIINDSSMDEENNLLNKYYLIKEQIDTLNKEISLNKIDRDKISREIIEIEEISKNSMLNTGKLEKELRDLELECSKLEIKIDNILNSLNEDYGITYAYAKDKYILEDNPEEVRKEVISLKSKIKSFGMVNLGSIDEFERINTRYEFLTKQREDLNRAEDTLLEIINDMDQIMKEKFVSTFNEIRVEFKKVFRELFKGGNADIYMTEPDNVLETGIELEATPPGKSLKNIQSLSGGERTFTAISLLFAILNVRPVPFCLFDEVEAALDEANVDAFGEYLDKYRDKTQFIIITHKKKTMEFIDTLYGITMQESGVSKRVSVKLNDISD